MADTMAKLSLLLLPQEIRDIIYGFVYTEATIHSKRICPKFHFTGIYHLLLQAKVDVRLVRNRERLDPVMNNFKMIGVSRVPEGARTTIYMYSSKMSAKQETAVTWRKALCELLAKVIEQLTRACPEPLLSDPCNPEGDTCVEHGVELQMAMVSVLRTLCGTELSAKELLESSTMTLRVKLS
ncbi:uncharacterized protein RHO25_003302 [Cercospora beticola]|uniref:Uncharacterized protein n=1 Tax=Cercospora beticola TaxID=122368 RepID=A0ABZ0NGN3_CERBT|nr:hypothetical protein RHO25_003302 [Cercospora beticola]